MKVKLISTNEPYIEIPKRTKYLNGVRYESTKFYPDRNPDRNYLLWESTTNSKDRHFSKTKAIYF